MRTVSALNIDGTDCKADHTVQPGPTTIRRAVNAVGSMEFYLDNTEDTYDDLLRAEHQAVQLQIDAGQFFYGHISRVDSIGEDDRGRWDKFVKVTALDQAEELLFFDDFEKTYNDPDQTLDDVLNDLWNVELDEMHIIYNQGTCPDVALGAFEKKEGQSLLAWLQEVHRSVDCIFYVDDSGYFKSKSLATITGSGVTLSRSNLIGRITYTRQDAGKLYNWIKLYGKNPQFDAWTEFNAAIWSGLFTPVDDTTTKRVGAASIKTTRTAGTAAPNLELDFTGAGSLFNYTSLELTKGDLGAWVRYDGANSLSPKAIRFQLYDGTNTINYYSGNVSLAITSPINRTQAYKEYWSWVSAPIGVQPDSNVNTCDHWWPMPLGGDFDWSNVQKISLSYEQASMGDYPDSFWIDGLTLPVPPISIKMRSGYPPWGTAVHKRPLVATRADLRTQNALDRAAETLLAQHQDAEVGGFSGVFAGDLGLRFAGLGFTGDFDLDMLSQPFYATQVTHVLNLRGDAGKGWDHSMQVEGVLNSARAYDAARLGARSVGYYSIPGIGLREK